jgi:hypothetical protein
MPKTRTNDPITSHQAAASIKNITETQRAILRILWRKQCTDVELVRIYTMHELHKKAPYASDSGIRSRRAELVERGYITPSGRLEKLPSGRNAIVWKPTGKRPLLKGLK